MRKLFFFLPLLAFGCTTGGNQSSISYKPQPSPLGGSLSQKRSVEGITSLPVDPNSLDPCTRHLLFADQYISVSDYGSAEEEIKKAEKTCSPEDPRVYHLRGIIELAEEKKEKAFNDFLKATQLYIKRGNEGKAFECYSQLLSLKPEAPEVKSLKHYFEDQDY